MKRENLLSYLIHCFKNSKSPRLRKDAIPGVIELLNSEDLKFRRYIGNLLINNSPLTVQSLFRASQSQEQEVRRSVIFLIGKILPTLEAKQAAEAETILVQALRDSDPKVRKNSAVALGKLRLTANERVLIDALDRETVSWVRSSIILAMGVSGTDLSMECLAAFLPENANEQRALEKAIDTLSVNPDRMVFDVKSKFEIVELWTSGGGELILINQLKKRHQSASTAENGRVTVKRPDFTCIQSLRTWREILFPLVKISSKRLSQQTSILESALRKVDLSGMLERSHEVLLPIFLTELKCGGNIWAKPFEEISSN